MRNKKLTKALNLNKTTVADLNGKEMKKVMGGVSGVDTTCLITKLICRDSQELYCITSPITGCNC